MLAGLTLVLGGCSYGSIGGLFEPSDRHEAEAYWSRFPAGERPIGY